MLNQGISMYFCETTVDKELALPFPHISCWFPFPSSMGSVHFRHSLGIKEPLTSWKSISEFRKLVSLSVKDQHESPYRIYRFFKENPIARTPSNFHKRKKDVCGSTLTKTELRLPFPHRAEPLPLSLKEEKNPSKGADLCSALP